MWNKVEVKSVMLHFLWSLYGGHIDVNVMHVRYIPGMHNNNINELSEDDTIVSKHVAAW